MLSDVRHKEKQVRLHRPHVSEIHHHAVICGSTQLHKDQKVSSHMYLPHAH